MSKNEGPNQLRAWREHRGFTQEQLATKLCTTPSVISMLESGKRGLSVKWLRRLSVALDASPGALVDHDPSRLTADVIDIWAKIDARDRPVALRLLETLVNDAKR